MTKTFDWPTERERATNLFNGDTPGAAIETAIVTHFTREPAKVATLITAIGRRVANGHVHSGWAILRHELDHVPPKVVATDTAERSKQLKIAEDWIRNAGGYIDRQDELISELFDQHLGPLRHWPDLEQQVVAFWLEQRTRFQKADHEAEDRARRHHELIARLCPNIDPDGTIDPDEHAANIAAEVERTTQPADADINWEAA